MMKYLSEWKSHGLAICWKLWKSDKKPEVKQNNIGHPGPVPNPRRDVTYPLAGNNLIVPSQGEFGE
jgi:hypothetical protein